MWTCCIFGVQSCGLAHVGPDLQCGNASGSAPAATVSPAYARRSAQGHGAAQYVGRHVEVVCNAFGYDASFSEFDLGHCGLYRDTFLKLEMTVRFLQSST